MTLEYINLRTNATFTSILTNNLENNKIYNCTAIQSQTFYYKLCTKITTDTNFIRTLQQAVDETQISNFLIVSWIPKYCNHIPRFVK